MVLQEFSPSPCLSAFVRTYRLVDITIPEQCSLPSKAYPPRPEHCLSFYARDFEKVEYTQSGKKEGQLKAVIFGQQTETTNRYIGNHFLLLQIVFKPGALFRLTNVPSYEITNGYLDAELLFPSHIKFVHEQLNECVSHQQMIVVIETFLKSVVQKKAGTFHRMDEVCNALIQNTTPNTVDWLAKQSHLSTRQFERIFKERMGVSPKYFIKVVRFEHAFRMRNQLPHLDWLTIALHCGYYDYQHLAKDYITLTQKTPMEFYAIDLTAPERIFGEADTY